MTKQPVGISHLEKDADRKQAVRDLFDQVHHIEVTSLVFRFVRPDEFGILSPPVAFILNVVPGRDSVETYERYCKILRELKDYYDLDRVADVDMALWTASHLQVGYQALSDRMWEDEFFQGIRLKNLLEGPGILFPPLKRRAKTERARDERRRLLFAEIVVKHHPFIGALVAVRSFEVLIKHLANKWGINCHNVPMVQLVQVVGGRRKAER